MARASAPDRRRHRLPAWVPLLRLRRYAAKPGGRPQRRRGPARAKRRQRSRSPAASGLSLQSGFPLASTNRSRKPGALLSGGPSLTTTGLASPEAEVHPQFPYPISSISMISTMDFHDVDDSHAIESRDQASKLDHGFDPRF